MHGSSLEAKVGGRQKELHSSPLSALLTVPSHFCYLCHWVHSLGEHSLDHWIFVPCFGEKALQDYWIFLHFFSGSLAEVTDHSHVSKKNNRLLFFFFAILSEDFRNRLLLKVRLIFLLLINSIQNCDKSKGRQSVVIPYAVDHHCEGIWKSLNAILA